MLQQYFLNLNYDKEAKAISKSVILRKKEIAIQMRV